MQDIMTIPKVKVEPITLAPGQGAGWGAQVSWGTKEQEELLDDPKQLCIGKNVVGHFGPVLAKCNSETSECGFYNILEF